MPGNLIHRALCRYAQRVRLLIKPQSGKSPRPLFGVLKAGRSSDNGKYQRLFYLPAPRRSGTLPASAVCQSAPQQQPVPQKPEDIRASKRFGKLRVEVETTVAPSATRARYPYTGTAGDLDTSTTLTEDAVVAFGQLRSVHTRWRCHPRAGRQLTFVRIQQFQMDQTEQISFFDILARSMSITAAYSASSHRLPAAQDSPAIFPCPEYDAWVRRSP